MGSWNGKRIRVQVKGNEQYLDELLSSLGFIKDEYIVEEVGDIWFSREPHNIAHYGASNNEWLYGYGKQKGVELIAIINTLFPDTWASFAYESGNNTSDAYYRDEVIYNPSNNTLYVGNADYCYGDGTAQGQEVDSDDGCELSDLGTLKEKYEYKPELSDEDLRRLVSSDVISYIYEGKSLIVYTPEEEEYESAERVFDSYDEYNDEYYQQMRKQRYEELRSILASGDFCDNVSIQNDENIREINEIIDELSVGEIVEVRFEKETYAYDWSGYTYDTYNVYAHGCKIGQIGFYERDLLMEAARDLGIDTWRVWAAIPRSKRNGNAKRGILRISPDISNIRL